MDRTTRREGFVSGADPGRRGSRDQAISQSAAAEYAAVQSCFYGQDDGHGVASYVLVTDDREIRLAVIGTVTRAQAAEIDRRLDMIARVSLPPPSGCRRGSPGRVDQRRAAKRRIPRKVVAGVLSGDAVFSKSGRAPAWGGCYLGRLLGPPIVRRGENTRIEVEPRQEIRVGPVVGATDLAALLAHDVVCTAP